jgi:hypothetical protein
METNILNIIWMNSCSKMASLLSIIKKDRENWYELLRKMKEEWILKCALNSRPHGYKRKGCPHEKWCLNSPKGAHMRCGA